MEANSASVPDAILVRISAARQETARQIADSENFASREGYEIVGVCRETVSVRANENEHHGRRRVEELAATGNIKKVLVHEVSRRARRNGTVQPFVETLEEYAVSLHWHQHGVETLFENDKRNPAAAVMLALLAEVARTEAETLRQRTNSGLAAASRKGKALGSPKGATLPKDAFLQKHKDIIRLLKVGHSVRNAAKVCPRCSG